jgi:hypothetical protein
MRLYLSNSSVTVADMQSSYLHTCTAHRHSTQTQTHTLPLSVKFALRTAVVTGCLRNLRSVTQLYPFIRVLQRVFKLPYRCNRGLRPSGMWRRVNIFSRCAGHQLPSDVAPHPSITEPSCSIPVQRNTTSALSRHRARTVPDAMLRHKRQRSFEAVTPVQRTGYGMKTEESWLDSLAGARGLSLLQCQNWF